MVGFSNLGSPLLLLLCLLGALEITLNVGFILSLLNFCFSLLSLGLLDDALAFFILGFTSIFDGRKASILCGLNQLAIGLSLELLLARCLFHRVLLHLVRLALSGGSD